MMPADHLSDNELRRIELAATANVASRSGSPGPPHDATIPDNVRADIGRYLVLEAGETMLRLVREIRAQAEALKVGSVELDRRLAAMIHAMDALESYSHVDARREAFEMLQRRFEGITQEDYGRAADLIPSLLAELDGKEPKP